MKLSDNEIENRLRELPQWSRKGDGITRLFTFKGFPDAIAFVVRLAFEAEAADHHPDLLVNYKRVTVTWSTHDQGGVTEKDINGARQADGIAATLAP